MKLPRRFPAFRLIDGVVVAAVALLGLKVMGLMSSGGEAPEMQAGSDPIPAFGRVLARARSNQTVVADPITTGSIAAKAEEPRPAEAASTPIGAPTLFPPSATERSLLERLTERREELQQRSQEVETREKLIQEQERRLDEKLGLTKPAEGGQKAAAGVAKTDPEPSPLKNIVTMYESMKPKEAARVFERLPLDILVSVVSGMNARKMAEILAAMSPDSAEKLTVALAAKARGQSGDRAMAAGSLPPGELQAIDPPAAVKR